jgi:hypothetical protein
MDAPASFRGVAQELVMKAPSPLLGFNNNFKHKGSVYHIQTEDSGVKHPHIITHLFADGGRILKSIKTSYAHLLQDPQMPDIVRQMMKDQHKAMIVALRDGRFDPGGSREVDLPQNAHFQAAAANAPPPVSRAKPEVPPVQAPAPEPKKISEPRLGVDPAALEKAAAGAASAALDDALPPPPANVLGGGASRPQETYSNVQGGARRSQRPPSMRPPAGGSRPPAAGKSVRPPPAAHHSDSRQLAASPVGGSHAPSRPPSTGRYAVTRPASIFATNKPSHGAGSIFGEDLISERSLDEVILAYLAEDLEGEKK